MTQPAIANLQDALQAHLAGKNLGACLNWSQEDYAHLSDFSAHALAAGRVEDARHLYGLLCRLDPLDARGFFGLGAVCQAKGEYHKAVHAYAQAAILDLDDPRPNFHAGQCLFQLKQFDKAAHALAAAQEQAARDAKHTQLGEQAATLAQAVAALTQSKTKGEIDD